MDDDQSLDDSIDSVIIGGTLLQQQGEFPDSDDDGGDGKPGARFEEECESTIHFGKLKFNWTIKEFLKVWQREQDEDRGDEGQKLSKEMLSRNFPCEAADDRVQFKLKIHLYPNVNDQAGSFISVYLVYCGKDEEVRANFEIAIVDDKGLKKNQRNSLKVCCFNEKEHPAWGFKKFVKVDVLKEWAEMNPGRDRDLVLRCTVNMVSDISSAEKEKEKEKEKERLAHPWTKFQRDLDELYENSQRYGDVIFVVEERRFCGHKLILGAGSPVMRRMFVDVAAGGHGAEPLRSLEDPEARPPIPYAKSKDDSGVDLITLYDLEAAVFEQILRFIYTGTIDEMFCPKTLLAAANQFQIKLLQETCEKELVSSFNKDNILDILTVAEQNDASKLKKHALENLNKCPPKSLNWQQLATEFPSILFDIMQMRFNQQLNSQKERRRGSDVSEQESFPPATPQLKRQRRH